MLGAGNLVLVQLAGEEILENDAIFVLPAALYLAQMSSLSSHELEHNTLFSCATARD